MQKDKKELAKQEELLKSGIMDYMGESAILKSNSGYKVSWKNQTQNRINSKLFKQENPDLYTEYSHDINVRPFKILKDNSSQNIRG